MHAQKENAYILEKLMVVQFRIIDYYYYSCGFGFIHSGKRLALDAVYANQFGSLSRHVDPKVRLEGSSFR